MKLLVKHLILTLCISFFSYSCMGGKRVPQTAIAKQSKMPSLVSTIANEIIISHLGYIASYNPIAKIPNWVAYELTKEETLGIIKRDNGFYPDPDLNADQATFDDYRNNAGWDKGHMAPAGDMKWSSQAMHESCYYTNICPQNHNLNNGDWKSLEDKCRTWAQKFGNIFIVCGPVIGEMINGTLGANLVVIPDAFFKVILAKSVDKYEGIGFVFENKAGHRNLSEYAMSIDNVESITGFDFFGYLPDKIENEMESYFSKDVWLAH